MLGGSTGLAFLSDSNAASMRHAGIAVLSAAWPQDCQ